MPGKPFASKLIPLLDFIAECRRQDWSYRRIATELQIQHNLRVAPSTIFSFVKVRSKKRKVIKLLQSSPPPRPERKPDHWAVSKLLDLDPDEFFLSSKDKPKKQ